MDELYQKSATDQSETVESWAEILDDIKDFHKGHIAAAEEGSEGQHLRWLRTLRAQAMLEADAHVAYTFKEWKKFCDSKIEEMFLMAAIAKAEASDRSYFLITPEYWQDENGNLDEAKLYHIFDYRMAEHGPDQTFIMMQVPVGKYRVDFLLYHMTAECEDVSTWVKVPLVIECDGHDFHERTKEQAKRDRSRDREMATAGLHVTRFTGSEIWRDPMACFCQAENLLFAILRDIRKHRRIGGGL